MTLPSSEQEREWAAEMRDFVADHRDALAAERDAISDERDRVADAREPALDVRERGLDARAAQLGLEPMSGHEVVLQERARALRAQERTDRADRAADRVTAADARDAATKRRLDENPTTRLAAAFASIAENLYAVDSYDAVLLTIAKAAVGTVTGCDMATVTIADHGSYHTGPARPRRPPLMIRRSTTPGRDWRWTRWRRRMVYAESFPDRRWPTLESHPVEFGAQSAASYRLAPTTPEDLGAAASLNTYGGEPAAFSDEAQEIGIILAAHASMAAGVVREREAMRDLADNLGKALVSRDVIGQAKGILMERLRLTAEDAFDVLRRDSNELNAKLHVVALSLAETGEIDPTAIPCRNDE